MGAFIPGIKRENNISSKHVINNYSIIIKPSVKSGQINIYRSLLRQY